MLSIYIVIVPLVCVADLVLGGHGSSGYVCRYSSDGPSCRTNHGCSTPEVLCYNRKCCVELEYACPNRYGGYDDPEGFPPDVYRCSPLIPFPPFNCGLGYYCRTTWGGSTSIWGVCCPIITFPGNHPFTRISNNWNVTLVKSTHCMWKHCKQCHRNYCILRANC